MDANSETSLERATTCLLAAVLGFIAEYRRVAELYMAALWPVEKPLLWLGIPSFSVGGNP